MTKSRWLVMALLAAAGMWYFFRPELVFIDTTVQERAPEGEATVVLRGGFRSVAHETTGVATVLHLAGGQRVLRLSPFETSNGPDVHICLVAGSDASDSSSVREAGYFCLDSMKANVGSQNYTIPDDLDLDRYRAVSVWCRRFSVNFGAAALSPTGPSSSS